MAVGPRVAVIGAGAIGTAVAAGLAARGAAVTIFEAEAPGTGTSGLSFAWVNSNSKHPEAYHALNVAGMTAHHRLLAEGGDAFVPNGRLEYATESAHAEELEVRMRRHAARGYPSEWITAARARVLEPTIAIPAEIDSVAWFPSEGHCWPERLIRAELAVATDHGARLRTGERVRDIEGHRIRLDSSAEEFDVVAVCAGRWTGDLVGASVPMVASVAGGAAVGYLAETGPLAPRPSRVITTSGLSVRPAQGGGLLLQALDLDDSADPGRPAPDRIGPELARRLATLLPGPEPEIMVRVGQRSLPADGLPVAGFTDPDRRQYVLATHSGITLAPLLGELAAREILGESMPELDPYRPDRFVAGRASTVSAPRRPGSQ